MTTPGTERLLDEIDAARNQAAIDPLTRAATALYYRIQADTPAAEAIELIRAGMHQAQLDILRKAACRACRECAHGNEVVWTGDGPLHRSLGGEWLNCMARYIVPIIDDMEQAND